MWVECEGNKFRIGKNGFEHTGIHDVVPVLLYYEEEKGEAGYVYKVINGKKYLLSPDISYKPLPKKDGYTLPIISEISSCALVYNATSKNPAYELVEAKDTAEVYLKCTENFEGTWDFGHLSGWASRNITELNINYNE